LYLKIIKSFFFYGMRRFIMYQLIIFVILLFISSVYTSCKKDKEVAQLPPVPSGLFPADGATDISISVTLTWVSSDTNEGVASYDVYLGTSAKQLEAVSSNLSKTTFYLSGLAANTTYYWKIVARDKNYRITSGEVLSFTTKHITIEGIAFNPNLQYGSVNDIDGNSYKTIRIGTQIWMAENLKTTKYNDGAVIQLAKEAKVWKTMYSQGYCWYYNDEATYKPVYGAIYNGYAAKSDKLCPTGWHVPSDSEWTNMITYLGGGRMAGVKLRESGTNHWTGGTSEGSNESGFSAMPANVREAYTGNFGGIGSIASFGSSSKTQSGNDFGLISIYYNNDIYRTYPADLRYGSSIRCCKDTPPSEPSIPSPANGATIVSTSPVLTWTCSDPDGDLLTYDIFLGTTDNPTNAISSGQAASYVAPRLTTSTKYYWKVIAKDSRGATTVGPVWSFTTSSEIQAEPDPVTDIDGNVYKTIKFGTQIWMAENLKTTRFKDGMVIPHVTENTVWSATESPAYCWYTNDEPAYKNIYGALYNLYTVSSGKICPVGWHAPAKSEWTILLNYLVIHGYNYDGSISSNRVAKALGSSTGWLSSNIQGAIGNTDYPDKINASGFTALPGGYRNANGYYLNAGSYGYWWLTDNNMFGYFYSLDYSYSEVLTYSTYKNNGMSVRCLKD
jgi:uncharacterized protein (TIGR02145 family)